MYNTLNNPYIQKLSNKYHKTYTDTQKTFMMHELMKLVAIILILECLHKSIMNNWVSIMISLKKQTISIISQNVHFDGRYYKHKFSTKLWWICMDFICTSKTSASNDSISPMLYTCHAQNMNSIQSVLQI